MDIIVENYFNKFLKEYYITGRNVESNFEKFINYICLGTKNINNFNLASMCVGAGGDAGIDGIGIAINNRFINDMAELTSIINMGIEFSVEFYFIQAKTSAAFECKEIATFGEGVVDMFRREDEIKKSMNDMLKAKYKMIREIINNYEYTIERKCILYYVTPGQYVEDENLLATQTRMKEDILGLELFDEIDIEINIKDKRFIRKQYEGSKVQNSASFKLDSKIEIPYMEKVEEAYFAIMPIKEYLKIVIDDEGKIRRGIFELNVRDFAGIEENRVNQDIAFTLLSDDKNLFGLMNNGITIVGKSLSKGQGKYTIKNFYIVNGCQTTNVLYENKEQLNDDMWISVKIVITQEDKVIGDIVKATNNQTEVQEIQLLSMDEYQEELEGFFNSFDSYTQLFYERRDGQYRGSSEVESIKIVNPETQMKCFASIFLNLPHIASRFVGKLQDEISKKIFVKEHRPIIYYTSALLNYKIEKSLLNEEISSNYAKFKYHIQMIISKIVWKDDKRPQLNSYKIDDYCLKLIKVIENEEMFLQLLQRAKQIIDIVVTNINDTEVNKTAGIVNELMIYCEGGLTKKEINELDYFVNCVETYIRPFKNMQIDGDMRYNFKNNLNDLIWLFDICKVNKYLNNQGFFDEVKEKVDESTRKSRIEFSQIVVKEVVRIEVKLEILLKKVKLNEGW